MPFVFSDSVSYHYFPSGELAMQNERWSVIHPACVSHKARYLVITKQGVPQRQLEAMLSDVLHSYSSVASEAASPAGLNTRVCLDGN